MKKTTEQTLIDFKKIHGDTYEYGLVVYEKATKKVNIVCRKHGVFSITPNSHLNGSGCAKCGREIVENSRRGNIETFIKKAREIHGDFYIYDQVQYQNFMGHVNIICPIHGVFKQQVRKHLSGNKCKKCVSESNFINFAKMCKTKFPQFNYDKVDYKGMFVPVIITCKEHGDFEVLPVSFYHKNRICKLCIHRTSSRPENLWLDSIGIPADRRNKYVKFGNKYYCVDGIDYDNKTVYEFYGDFFHGNPEVYESNQMNPLLKETYGELYEKTIIKENIIKQNGFKLITIWEKDFKPKK